MLEGEDSIIAKRREHRITGMIRPRFQQGRNIKRMPLPSLLHSFHEGKTRSNGAPSMIVRRPS